MITITDIENKVLAWNINFDWKMPKIARILRIDLKDALRRKYHGTRKLVRDELAREINCKYMYYGKINDARIMTYRCLWEFLWAGSQLSATAACMHKIGTPNHCFSYECPYKHASYESKWFKYLLYGDGKFSAALTPAEKKRLKSLLGVSDE